MSYQKFYKCLGRKYISAAQIEKRIFTLAREIESANLPGPLHVGVILTGGMVFGERLISRIRIPTIVHPIIKTAKGGFFIPRPERLEQDLLLVDCLIDTGRTMINLGKVLEDTPVRHLQIATLVHTRKVSSNDVFVNWVGFDHHSAIPLVGFGMDHEGFFRNLPDIHIYG